MMVPPEPKLCHAESSKYSHDDNPHCNLPSFNREKILSDVRRKVMHRERWGGIDGISDMTDDPVNYSDINLAEDSHQQSQKIFNQE